MSDRKFASITGSLLARKGEAGPSADRAMLARRWQPQPQPQPQLQPEVAVVSPQPRPVAPTTPDRDARVKVALRLSQAQHFRLRVAAAQLQVTRQSLMAAALDHYLATVCAAGVPECRCLRSAKTCEKSCDCAG